MVQHDFSISKTALKITRTNPALGCSLQLAVHLARGTPKDNLWTLLILPPQQHATIFPTQCVPTSS
eukprot:1090757-Karenia_brevis.AAC.1